MARYDDDEYDDDDYFEEVPAGPKPKVSTANIVLFVLNVLAALGFVYMLTLDFHARQQWTYQTFLRELAIQGLPLQQEEDARSASRVTLPRQRLTPDMMAAVFRARGGAPGEAFHPIDEPFPTLIRPSHLTEEVLADYFDGLYRKLPDPVASLEEEVARLKEQAPADILKAAQVYAAGMKDDADGRKKAADLLLPLCWNVHQVEQVDARLAKTSGAELKKLLEDAAERAMLLQVLAPLEIFRPGEVDLGKAAPADAPPEVLAQLLISKGVEQDVFPRERLRKILQNRIEATLAETFSPDTFLGKEFAGQKRDSIEKRQTLAMLHAALGQLAAPDGKRLYPRGWDRGQAVLGLYAFAEGIQHFAAAQRVLEKRLQNAIAVDREGYLVNVKGTTKTSQGFVDKQRIEIDRIRTIMVRIHEAREVLEDMRRQRVQARELYEKRVGQLQAALDKLTRARAETARLTAEVRTLQTQLFQAQVDLADAADRNFALERDIRRLEIDLYRLEKRTGGARR